MAPPPSRARARFDRALARVAADRRSGASGLAAAALDAVEELVSASARSPPAEFRRIAAHVARRLRATQPALGALVRSADAWTRLATRPRPRADAVRWLALERRRREGAARALRRVVRERLPPRLRVLTLSRSATVVAALAAPPARRRPRSVVVLESRPGGEGRAMVRDLRRRGVRARWVPDRELATAVRSADLVLIGADAVYRTGDLVHKVGTRTLVDAARRAGVPTVVVSAYAKFVDRRRPVARRPTGFDRTPGRWIEEFWTDRGVRRPGRRANALRTLALPSGEVPHGGSRTDPRAPRGRLRR